MSLKVNPAQVAAAKTTLASETCTKQLRSEQYMQDHSWFAKVPLIARFVCWLWTRNEDAAITAANAKAVANGFGENCSKYSTALGEAQAAADATGRVSGTIKKAIAEARGNMASRIVTIVTKMDDKAVKSGEARATVAAAKEQVKEACAELSKADRDAHVQSLMSKMREEAVAQWAQGFDLKEADTTLDKAVAKEANELVKRGIFDSKEEATKALKKAFEEKIQEAGKKAAKQLAKDLAEEDFDVQAQLDKEVEKYNALKDQLNAIIKQEDDGDEDTEAEKVQPRFLGWLVDHLPSGTKREAVKAVFTAQKEREALLKDLKKTRGMNAIVERLNIVKRVIEGRVVQNLEEANPFKVPAKELKKELKKVRSEIEKGIERTNPALDKLLDAHEAFIEALEAYESVNKDLNKIRKEMAEIRERSFGGAEPEDDRAYDTIERRMQAARENNAMEVRRLMGRKTSNVDNSDVFGQEEAIAEARSVIRGLREAARDDEKSASARSERSTEATEDDDLMSLRSEDSNASTRSEAPRRPSEERVERKLKNVNGLLELAARKARKADADEVLKDLRSSNVVKARKAIAALEFALDHAEAANRRAMKAQFKQKPKKNGSSSLLGSL